MNNNNIIINYNYNYNYNYVINTKYVFILLFINNVMRNANYTMRHKN